MNRDPFYREIIKRLKDTLDPELFERCAADLLRPSWPGLVPIRGGTDAGMDGAIGDGKGEPFPLISTTSPDVIGNLTLSLEARVRDGWNTSPSYCCDITVTHAQKKEQSFCPRSSARF